MFSIRQEVAVQIIDAKIYFQIMLVHEEDKDEGEDDWKVLESSCAEKRSLFVAGTLYPSLTSYG